MKKKRRIENRIIAVILCMAILFSQVNIADAADVNPSGTNTSQVTLSDDANKSNGEVSTESTVSDEINGTTESESKISEETSENSKNDESESSGGNVKAESTDNIDAYYKDSKICIYNYEQLKQIGSDAYIYTGDKDGKIGSGEVVKNEGTELKYGADAQYILMNDIQMNSEQIWSVPDSFTGTITGTKLEENETPTLYDKETDTYYTQTVVLPVHGVLIAEGVFLQRAPLKNQFDKIIYLSVPESVRLNRVLQRDTYIGTAQQIIEKYKNDKIQKEMESYATGLNDLGGAFGNLASMVEQSAGKQSAAYKAMFAISKAFAIAEATVKLSQAIVQAMADPSALTPAQKFANMAAVASAGVNLISQITSVAAFATGGHVQGPGTGTSDSIPAWLSNNEFVMTSRTVDHYGVAFMNALNQRRLPRFASGGRVGGGGSPSYPGISSNGGEGDHNEISITINIAKDGEDVTVDQQIAQSKALSDAITVKVLEVMRKQRGRDGGLLN